MSEFLTKILELDSALELAPLISAYAQERKRGRLASQICFTRKPC